MLWKIQSQGFDLNHISMSDRYFARPPLPAALDCRGIGRLYHGLLPVVSAPKSPRVKTVR